MRTVYERLVRSCTRGSGYGSKLLMVWLTFDVACIVYRLDVGHREEGLLT